MDAIIIKALCYLILIFLGFILKKYKVFSNKDFAVLSKVSINITLPAVLITCFKDFTLSIEWLYCILLGILVNVVIVAFSTYYTKKRDKKTQAMYILNCSSFNIGGFVLPFITGIYPANYILYASMFDVGNAIMCTGVNYACASSRINSKTSFSINNFISSMMSSVPFVTYLVMLLISLLGIQLPESVFEIATSIGNANIVIVMLMLGIIIETKIHFDDIKDISKLLIIRYGFSFIISILILFFFPADLLGRQILVLCIFAPISSIMPAFSAKLNCKASVYGAVNSICMPLSIILLSFLMIVWM